MKGRINIRFCWLLCFVLTFFYMPGWGAGSESEFTNAPSPRVLLRTGMMEIDLQRNPVSTAFNFLTQKLSPSSVFEDRYYIITFKDLIKEEWKRLIEVLGIHPIQYIPENSYLVRMNPVIRDQV